MKRNAQRISLQRIFLTLFALFAALVVFYLILAGVHASRTSWMNSDKDKDLITLKEDMDPDGDGVAFLYDTDSDSNGLSNEKQAVQYARGMLNTPFDPVMGKYDDLLGKAGFVVCVDVPLRSYMKAGVSFPKLLEQAARDNPGWFDIDAGNYPGNKFFYRRVRNYYELFKKHAALSASGMPSPGAWAFYGNAHVGIVESVRGKNDYTVIEADPYPYRVVKKTNAEMLEHWGQPDYFGSISYDKQSK